MDKISVSEYCIFPKIRDYSKIDCIGLKIDENKKGFKIIFPVNYFPEKYFENDKINISEEELKEDIKNLLLAIYKSNLSQIYDDKSVRYNTCPIDSIFWIMRNYIENGYYREIESVYKRESKGKIDWKKTIKNTNFLIDNNFNILYNKFITKHFKYNESSLITLVHKYCVYVASDLFGFIYNLDPKTIEKPEIDEEMANKDFLIKMLKEEYAKSFLDSKKELLLNMIKILEWKTYGKSGFDMFNITESKFEVTFENVVDENFGNISDINTYYPIGMWNINGVESKSSCLREDTIYDFSKNNISNKKIFIIDAKYYVYTSENSQKGLPNTSSIAKQIIYGESVNKKKENYEVYNIFIIPFCSKDTEKIKYVGYAYGDWRDNNKKYDKIYTFKVDLRTLVNGKIKKEDGINYISNDIMNYINDNISL